MEDREDLTKIGKTLKEAEINDDFTKFGVEAFVIDEDKSEKVPFTSVIYDPDNRKALKALSILREAVIDNYSEWSSMRHGLLEKCQVIKLALVRGVENGK